MAHWLGVFALGYDDLSEALVSGMALKLAALLLVGKLLATIAGYGLGGCGGIFSPNLFFRRNVWRHYRRSGSAFPRAQSVRLRPRLAGAMSACLGAVVQAPVTAILIIFEMTHQFALVPGLMLAGLVVSQIIARSLQKENFYDQILFKTVTRSSISSHPLRDLRSWQNLPISLLANFQPVVIEDLSREALQKTLENHPYRFFPVIDEGNLKGVAARHEIESAVVENRAPKLTPACDGACSDREHTIREAQMLL